MLLDTATNANSRRSAGLLGTDGLQDQALLGYPPPWQNQPGPDGPAANLPSFHHSNLKSPEIKERCSPQKLGLSHHPKSQKRAFCLVQRSSQVGYVVQCFRVQKPPSAGFLPGQRLNPALWWLTPERPSASSSGVFPEQQEMHGVPRGLERVCAFLFFY